MKTIYLIESHTYNDSTDATDTEVIDAFSQETDATAETEKLDAQALAAWVARTGSTDDADGLRTKYSVRPMHLK